MREGRRVGVAFAVETSQGGVMGMMSEIMRACANIDAAKMSMAHLLEAGRFDEVRLHRLRGQVARARSELERLIEIEQAELFPHAERILGDSIEEVSSLSEYGAALGEDLGALADTLDGSCAGAPVGRLRSLFDQFCASFEAHHEAQRAFFTLYSTILFPSDVSPD